MKINLISPPSPWLISDTDIPFLGILYLSSYLKQHGFDVTVTDLAGIDINDWSPDKYDIYGITGTSAHFPQIQAISFKINRYYPTAQIVAGGPHATLAPHHLLMNTAVDTCVMGPGEKRFLNLLQTGKSDGTVYWKDEAIVYSAKDSKSEIYDMAQIPDYQAIDFKKYLPSQTYKYLLGTVNESTILTTLGCPHNCNFCAQDKMREKIKFVPLVDVSKNIDYLREQFDVKLFYVTDDTFGFAKGRFTDLCNMFRKKGIHWHCLLRADLATESRLKTMKDSGCLGVVYGFETGSNKILKLMNKGVTSQQNYAAAYLTHTVGMKVRGQMVVGFPGENDTTIRETKLFIESTPVDHWGIHTFVPYPGSDVWYFPEKYGIKIDRETDFANWHTIGKPTEKGENLKVQNWVDYLREIAGNKSIERVGE